MPLYEYRCRKCHRSIVRLQKSGHDESGIICPGCGRGPLRKVYSTFNTGGSSRVPGKSAGRGEAGPDRHGPAGPEFYPLMVTNNPENLK